MCVLGVERLCGGSHECLLCAHSEIFYERFCYSSVWYIIPVLFAFFLFPFPYDHSNPFTAAFRTGGVPNAGGGGEGARHRGGLRF